MRRVDEAKTQELVNIFERAYNGTSVGKLNLHQYADEIIELLKPLVDAVYDEKKRKSGLVDVACKRFRQQNAIVSQKKVIETNAYELMGRRWGIRAILHRHYRRTRTDITLRQLHQTLSHEHRAAAEIITLDNLKAVLPKLGFTVFTTRNANLLVLDEHKSRLRRIHYLRRMQTIRRQRKSIVYLCEASVDVIVGASEGEPTMTGDRPSRLILLYAASQDGLINFTFAHKQSHEITADNFIDWLQAVAGNLDRGTALIVETQHYTTADPRECQEPSRRELLRWLKVHDIMFEEEWTTIELRDAVRHTQSVNHAERINFLLGRKTSRIERIAKQTGHNLVHIPEHHPELRPFAESAFFATATVDASDIVGATTPTAIAEMARNCIRRRLDESTAQQWALHCAKIVDVETQFLEFEQFVNEVETAGEGSSRMPCPQRDVAIVIDSSEDDS